MAQLCPSGNTYYPFNSPNPSMLSLRETDDGSTSGQSEFHLERYSSTHRYDRHPSQSTNIEEKDKKPDLNIITTFAVPTMPMKSGTVVVSEVPSKQVRADRKNKSVSIISHKAVKSTISPPDEGRLSLRLAANGLKKLNLPTKSNKKSTSMRRLHNVVMQKQTSPSTQRMPIGTTIPQDGAATLEQNITDTALPLSTPTTPAIVITPAGNQQAWILQQKNADGIKVSASSMSSAMANEKTMHAQYNAPRIPHGNSLPDQERANCRKRSTSHGSSQIIQLDSADSARPKSQGWWTLMLSPMLRAGSVASRKGMHAVDTPPVPPLPFLRKENDSPALSARSDPSPLVPDSGTSPETPRRLGLGSARASTWSRWTEWEQTREVNAAKDDNEAISTMKNPLVERGDCVPAHQYPRVALAAEYFHACAVEQLTGQSYFECVNHSCAEKLPKLLSVYDSERPAALASPFESPLVHSKQLMPGHEENTTIIRNSLPKAEREVDLSPAEPSPNVRQAKIAAVVKGKGGDEMENNALETERDNNGLQTVDKNSVDAQMAGTMPLPQPAPIYSAPRNNDDLPSIVTFAGPPQVVEIHVTQKAPSSQLAPESMPEKANLVHVPQTPGPMSPEGQKSIAPSGDVALSDMDPKHPTHTTPVIFNNYARREPLPGRPAFVTADTEYPPLPDRIPTAPVTAADIASLGRGMSSEKRRQRHEKEDAAARKVGGLWRGRGCFPKNGCMGRGGPEKRTKRRWIVAIALLLLVVVIVSVALAVTLTRRGDQTPLESQWLNLTGYPAMPTGILTIAAPNLVASQKQCVSPSTSWSCSVPKDDQDESVSNDSDQPNFRFEIKFRNGTVPANMTIPLPNSGTGTRKTSKDPFTNDLFVANPRPPNQADQIFLGNTTDNITAPFDGEVTPFFITFMSTFPQIPSAYNDTETKRFFRRQSNSSQINNMPAPALADDGSAAPAALLPTNPFPISQPVKLYNRGLKDEHYGFYMYYDKSIYLSGVKIKENKATNNSSEPADLDQDGGCTKTQANAVCTFSQTRFLFKAFTSQSFAASLLPSTANANLTHPDDAQTKNTTSSATNFDRPGSFPYPATIVTDRHGGDVDAKGVHCYGMKDGKVLNDEKIRIGEVRGFGGVAINAAPALGGAGSSTFNETAGGIDGGTAGCFCDWQNWQ